MLVTGDIGRRVRTARQLRGISVRTFAEQLGRAVGTVYRWEQGRRDPGLDDLRTIAALLHVEPGWLVCGRGQMRLVA